MSISIGLVGLGSFGSVFADLFKAHPLVDRVGLCDVEKDRVAKFAKDSFFADKFNARDAYYSLDDICKADFDALAIITQPWLHAPQCIQAMESGKHVYSAVPTIYIPDGDETIDWCGSLIDTCKKTGMLYMLGETTYYRACAMFCRRMAREGRFGDFVYAEGEYCHDVDAGCNVRIVQRDRTSGIAGKEHAEISARYRARGCKNGPMHYPTHSTSGPVCVMNAHAVKATAYGFENRNGDPHFKDHAFSNEMALFKMSNGATVRIAEMRESPGMLGNSEETFRVMGTRGTYSEDRWFETKRPDFANLNFDNLPKPEIKKLTADETRDPLPSEVQEAFKRAMNKKLSEEDIQNLDFNPAGHGGSHPYLVHEFVDSVADRRQPAINAWEAARYMVMGVMAHKSALRDGETLDVPDWGDAPSGS